MTRDERETARWEASGRTRVSPLLESYDMAEAIAPEARTQANRTLSAVYTWETWLARDTSEMF